LTRLPALPWDNADPGNQIERGAGGIRGRIVLDFETPLIP
jgi:hypothetical protein